MGSASKNNASTEDDDPKGAACESASKDDMSDDEFVTSVLMFACFNNCDAPSEEFVDELETGALQDSSHNNKEKSPALR